MENKKNNIGLVVLVCVIVATLTMIIGVYIGINMSDKNSATKVENNKDLNNSAVKEEDYDLVAAEKLINKYAIFKNGYDDATKKYIAWVNVSNSLVSERDCSFLYEGVQTTIDGGGYKGITGGGYCDLTAKTINYSDLNESYQNLFGKNMNLEEKGFAFFDYVNGKFIQLNTRGAIRVNSSVTDSDNENIMMNSYKVYAVKSAKKDGNKLIIDVSYTVLKGENVSSVNLYSSFDKDTAYTLDEIKADSFNRDFVNKYSDQMDTYKFTFEYEDDHYILKDIIKL